MKLTVFLFLLWTTNVFGQFPYWEWAEVTDQKWEPYVYPSYNRCEVDRFGNLFILEGQKSSLLVTKYTTNGNKVWQSERKERISGIKVDLDGNLYAFGADSSQGLLVKFDPYGKLLWTKKFKSLSSQINSVAVTSINNIIVGGFYNDNLKVDNYEIHNSYSYFLSELTPLGNVSWLVADTSYHIQELYSLNVTKTGDIYASYEGNTIQTNPYNGYNPTGIVCFNSNGTIKLKKTFPSASINIDDSSNLYLEYYSDYGTSSWTSAIAKMDSLLNLKWSKTVSQYSGGPITLDLGHLRPGAGNTLYMAGSLDGVFSPNGRVVVGPDTFKCNGGPDLIVTQISKITGEYLKSYHLGGSGEESISDFGIDPIGNIYVAGYHRDTLCFNSSECLIPTASQISFVAKLKFSEKEFTDGVGIAEKIKGNFRMYPIPADEKVSITFADIHQIRAIDIFSSSGQKMTSGKFSDDRLEVEVSLWKDGIYFIKVLTTSGQYCQKLVISH